MPNKSTDLSVPVLGVPRPHPKLATPLARVLCFGWFGRWAWGTLPGDQRTAAYSWAFRKRSRVRARVRERVVENKMAQKCRMK